MNIYAPNGFDDNKVNFFTNVFETIGQYDCDVILGGDFNVTLNDSDRLNRGTTARESELALLITEFTEHLGLADIWLNKVGYTWRKGKIMSKLDRIYTRLSQYQLEKVEIDWTFTSTDHAAVITQFRHVTRQSYKSSHLKLDNDILKNNVLLLELKQYLIDQLNDVNIQNFNPHTRLEFAKMTIRTKAMDIMARTRKKEYLLLKELNSEISQNTQLLTIYTDCDSQVILQNELDNAINQRNVLLQAQGEKLANKAKTKWYNEGEGSNKYFLNLLKRQGSRNEMSELIIDGSIIKDPKLISQHVTDFYCKLYNHGRNTNIDDDFLAHMFSVDEVVNDSINRDITIDELWQTLRPLRATTPGPDGMSNVYLKKLWDILGPLILDSWKYSIETGELAPSHKNSLLRLIPKAGKDPRELKNWRPITLSNCDHKLITKTYNTRLVTSIKEHIISTQTAYLKGRNISDNLRLINALIGAVKFNLNIDATLIALDAQKAFDSVSHDYIAQVLDRVGLSNFIPIFRLLYKDLENDILINGQLGNKYKISNGVKQGDALSCSLFLLAMEPVIRNIENNAAIQSVGCNRLNFVWPKTLAYADDVSIITRNDDTCVKEVFKEYWKLSLASGLFLNADKTEKFNITNEANNTTLSHDVTYGHTTYRVINLDVIKINGIFFSNNIDLMADENARHMSQKMNIHFTDWSKRNLSLLGKIQIIKTFGISQYLYSLAVIDLLPRHWKMINKLIAKFIWNKHYAGNRAPNRFKNDILYTKVKNGGFGMIKLEEVANCIRLRRFSILEETQMHPISQLQQRLGSKDHLQSTCLVDIDPVTTSALTILTKFNLQCYYSYDTSFLENDALLRIRLCTTKLVNLFPKKKFNSREATTLRRNDIVTLHDLLNSHNDNFDLLLNICYPELTPILVELFRHEHIDHDANFVNLSKNHYVYENDRIRWRNLAASRSADIRDLIYKRDLIVLTKMCNFDPEVATRVYAKIQRISSIPLRTKALRLVHGDVYSGSRLVKFNLSDIDTCIRCFDTETIQHLLTQCPFSSSVWNLLGINHATINDILDFSLTESEFEIRCAIVEMLVFRKLQMPPNKIVEVMFKKYASGLSKRKKLIDYAKTKLSLFERTGQWH